MNDTSYAPIWRQYRRANWSAGLWLVLGLPGIVALAILLKLAVGEDAGVYFVVLCVLWAIVWAVLCIRVTRFRCPRCGGLYFSHSQLYFSSGKHCGACGLALYSNDKYTSIQE